MIKKFASVIWVATCAALIITFVPLSKVEKAFATIRLASSDAAVANQPGPQRSCEDFEIWFLNAACSNLHAKHMVRMKHHVRHS
jgi:hypothetical protein